MGFPLNAFRSTKPFPNARSAPLFPQQVIHRRPDNDYRAIDYPVFCRPAETPVTVERIRLMYSAFFSSAISS